VTTTSGSLTDKPEETSLTDKPEETSLTDKSLKRQALQTNMKRQALQTSLTEGGLCGNYSGHLITQETSLTDKPVETSCKDHQDMCFKEPLD